MAALQTAMFPILVIRLPKREGDGEEEAEAGRHLKRKTRIRGVFGEGGEEKDVEMDGKKRGGESPTDAEFLVQFSAAPPSFSGGPGTFSFSR